MSPSEHIFTKKWNREGKVEKRFMSKLKIFREHTFITET
jgi:hypothetical protein